MLKPHNPFKAIRAHAWFSPTHSYILSEAFLLLKERQADVFKALRPYRSYIEEGAVIPDFKGDVNKGSGSHYYSPVLKDGTASELVEGYYKNRLGRFSKSARTMCEENVTLSAIFKRAENRKMYGESIGRALHFIMDICCPVHTSNLISLPFKGNPHHAFEIYSETNMKRLTRSDIDGIDAFERKYLYAPVGEIFNSTAKLSCSFYGDVKGLTDGGFDKALCEMLPTAIAMTYIMLINIQNYADKYNGLKIGDKFLLRNEDGYLFSKKSRVYFTDDKKEALKFTLKCYGDRLYLMHEDKYLSCDGDYGFKLSKLNSRCAVRITKQGGNYLFSTVLSNGEKYFYSKKHQLQSSYFDPTNRSFYFKIIK